MHNYFSAASVSVRNKNSTYRLGRCPPKKQHLCVETHRASKQEKDKILHNADYLVNMHKKLLSEHDHEMLANNKNVLENLIKILEEAHRNQDMALNDDTLRKLNAIEWPGKIKLFPLIFIQKP
jgi:hypothetical protein